MSESSVAIGSPRRGCTSEVSTGCLTSPCSLGPEWEIELAIIIRSISLPHSQLSMSEYASGTEKPFAKRVVATWVLSAMFFNELQDELTTFGVSVMASAGTVRSAIGSASCCEAAGLNDFWGDDSGLDGLEVVRGVSGLDTSCRSDPPKVFANPGAVRSGVVGPDKRRLGV